MSIDVVDGFNSIAGNRDHLSDMIGFEPIMRACRVVLAEGLNDQIVHHTEIWANQDLENQRLGFDPGVGQVEVMPVPLEHLHMGAHPSLLASPIEAYPAVAIMAHLTNPSPDSQQFDQIDASDFTLGIEVYIVAGPVPPGEETAFETISERRIARTTEAVHSTIRRASTLLNTVNPIARPPKGGIGNPAWLRQEQGVSTRYFIRASRLQYTLQRYAAF